MTTTTRIDRALHLVDVENLTGTCNCTLETVTATASGYLNVALNSDEDQFVIASSCNNAPASWFGWPTSAQRLMRSGENGAELALLEAWDPHEIALHFRRIVIGSGDGIFAQLACALSAAGCHVTVVSRPEALSNRLRIAAQTIVFLPPTLDDVEAICAA
jgi:hypothetical protein